MKNALLSTLAVSTVVAAVAAGCSYDDRVGYATPPPSDFAPTVDAAAPDGDASSCVVTECEVPYATCPRSDFRCQVNLDSDPLNCGGCDIRCPGWENPNQGMEATISARWLCNGGKCEMTCTRDHDDHADCNGKAGDGCEIDISCDPDNCGGCGNKCPDGVACIRGQCGCPTGLTLCSEPICLKPLELICKDLDSDSSNCGGCGIACPPRLDLPPNMAAGCGNGSCDAIDCKPFFANCNGELEDGCEVATAADPANCGGCGVTCDPGQFCFRGSCYCPPGAIACSTTDQGASDNAVLCIYPDIDPNNCGACGRMCPGPRDPYSVKVLHATPACRYGRCSLDCAAGYADCDGNGANGCETQTSTDPQNCGGCGIRCDVLAGQPCVRGQCAVGACPEGPVQ